MVMKDFNCPDCGGNDFRRAGTYPTRRFVMGKWQCNRCGRIITYRLARQSDAER